MAMCVKVINDTLKLVKLLPSALVHGVYSSTRALEEPRNPKPTMLGRVKLADTTHAEMDKQMASFRMNRELCHNAFLARDVVYDVGNQALFYRERQVNNGLSEWLGRFTFQGIGMD